MWSLTSQEERRHVPWNTHDMAVMSTSVAAQGSVLDCRVFIVYIAVGNVGAYQRRVSLYQGPGLVWLAKSSLASK